MPPTSARYCQFAVGPVFYSFSGPKTIQVQIGQFGYIAVKVSARFPSHGRHVHGLSTESLQASFGTIDRKWPAGRVEGHVGPAHGTSLASLLRTLAGDRDGLASELGVFHRILRSAYLTTPQALTCVLPTVGVARRSQPTGPGKALKTSANAAPFL